MAPVFTYRWQQWLFFSFLSFMLALPYLPKAEWMDRSILYRFGAYSKYHTTNIIHQVIQEQQDIDILFIGSSTAESAVNAKLLKKELEPYLHREPIIYVIGHPEVALDYDYVVLRDILQSKNIKLLIWEIDPVRTNHRPYKYTNFLWDMNLHHEIVKEARLPYLDTYFFSYMTGLKLLLRPIRDILPHVHVDERCDVHSNFGSCMRKTKGKTKKEKIFPPPTLAIEKLVHKRLGSGSKIRENVTYTSYDHVFIKEVYKLADKRNMAIAFHRVPKQGDLLYKEIEIPYMRRSAVASKSLIVGPVPYELFYDRQDVKDKNIAKMFFNDPFHYNRNGTSYYTKTIFPGILNLYQKMVTHIDRHSNNTKSISH